jgi:hypothetical protein
MLAGCCLALAGCEDAIREGAAGGVSDGVAAVIAAIFEQAISNAVGGG